VRLLLDTHLLLWSAGTFSGPQSPMSRQADELIDDMANALFFSAASIWEVAIKASLGRPSFRADPNALRRALAARGYVELVVTAEHGAAVAALPPIHKDPFDRLLVAQATVEGLTLLTSDAELARYGAPVRRV
jgi:PIN domain nuclease of toxin-antitoxin system